MPSPPPWRAWTPPGSGWWPGFAMAWTAAPAVPSGRSGRGSVAPRPGPASCTGAPSPASRWPHWAQIQPGAPHRRACGVAVQPATEVLGDPTDPQAPARMRAFVDQALPHVRPQVSAQLLIKLADLVELEVDLLAWGRDHALCRAIAAIHPTLAASPARPRGPRVAHRCPADRAGGGSPPRRVRRGRQRTHTTRPAGWERPP